ncbi:molybdopterin molybdotransferase MoeA [Halalkalicoccus jeotgali]|uniref:Molybdenum cofactor synthesis domain protein n=1 Tax=Halalkalicoccus jeotgali (strain DSM 18796 / CECT 7217 / JCM 14584 / KCTC 4019 / B3) TaxID=795797 RepID=D8JA85_HALJB|nr:gephyrin-like molybdotransferase Glp [Halalkalicoccus jeotgali]ADJ14607.1 molybdenum cofactor synthesis domain protein [Halalkalicoccus jeotgali B3]ELY39980.1 molybdenum cofactor synthesis protein [Halalkalicoccus jeotgali B3]
MSQDDLQRSGFKERTRIDEARERLLDRVTPHERSERVSLARADGRTLAARVSAPKPVPGYDRAAMDGYAVRAADTFGASERSPNLLREGEDVGPETAVQVHTGSELPAGADAVVMIEQVAEIGGELEVSDAVAEGENVGPTGEDVSEGQTLYEPGHRVRPSDLGLLKSVGLTDVAVRERPTVSVIPTGEELVQADPQPGEVIETNALTVSRFVDRWGGRPTYRDIVTDDHEALRAAIQRDLTKDLIVTTGGSSVGERDLIPEVVDDIGEVLVHGVALKPGHPVALGIVEDTPVLMLPGYPVACIVNAVQFLRPALKRAGGMACEDHPTTEAALERKIRSEPGIRTFARVKLDRDGGEPTALPTRVSGSGVLSSVALADGWVVVPEEREGIAEGETVAVENWEWSP